MEMNCLNGNAKIFILSDNTWASDQHINACVKKIAKGGKVVHLRVPQEFRESFLGNHNFVIVTRGDEETDEEWEKRKEKGFTKEQCDRVLSYEYSLPYCDFCFFYNPKNLDAFENDEEEGDSIGANSGYVCTDFIYGLSGCSAYYTENRRKMMKEILDTRFPGGVSNKIISFEGEKDLDALHTLELCTNETVTKRTSTIYEWVTFMHFPFEEESYSLLLNCNEKSKYYGYVFLHGHQEIGKMLCHISEFIKTPLKYMNHPLWLMNRELFD
jgi:hypothetical protein